jgi:hypothetical protein
MLCGFMAVKSNSAVVRSSLPTIVNESLPASPVPPTFS